MSSPHLDDRSLVRLLHRTEALVVDVLPNFAVAMFNANENE